MVMAAMVAATAVATVASATEEAMVDLVANEVAMEATEVTSRSTLRLKMKEIQHYMVTDYLKTLTWHMALKETTEKERDAIAITCTNRLKHSNRSSPTPLLKQELPTLNKLLPSKQNLHSGTKRTQPRSPWISKKPSVL